MKSEEYLQGLKRVFHNNGDPERALHQSAYLRNQFDCYGLKTAEWLGLFTSFVKENGLLEGEELNRYIELSFEDEYREIQYAAVEMTQRQLKRQQLNFIDAIEYMIVTKSWWDTVDWLAKLAGMHFLKFPELMKPRSASWISSPNMWLRRSAIIFQLSYKEKTNEDLLFKYILKESASKEFFIQKAAGWALRQHSRINPAGVIEFISNHQLSPLTRREGLKWMKNKGLLG